MSGYDHFRPPDHLSPMGKVAFRVFCAVGFTVSMALFIYFVVPFVLEYVSKPFSAWVGSFF